MPATRIKPGETGGRELRRGGERDLGGKPAFTVSPSNSAPGPRCPDCGAGLVVISGGHQLNFSCDQGHVYLLHELISRGSRTILAGLQTLLTQWREKATLLRRVAADARRYGYEAVGATFERQAESIEIRSRLLQRGLTPSL